MDNTIEYEWTLSDHFVEPFKEYLEKKKVKYSIKEKLIDYTFDGDTMHNVKVKVFTCNMTFARFIAADDYLHDVYMKLYLKDPDSILICE